jgi:Phage integrase, N-terminal SAM-like domain
MFCSLTFFIINVNTFTLDLGFPMVERPKKILDQLRDVIRLKHYSYRTEQTYVDWVYRFIVFHNKRHPSDMGAPEIEAFLTHLAVQRRVAAPTQNQALSALVFLYRHVRQMYGRAIAHFNPLAQMPAKTDLPPFFARPVCCSDLNESILYNKSHKGLTLGCTCRRTVMFRS